jgi:threonine synthase
MQYVSTRGQTPPMGFAAAALAGLAPDGGLLVPAGIPDVSGRLEAWSRLPYPDLALEVIGLFADLPRNDLERIVRGAYASFEPPEVVPVVTVGPVRIAELFHGPTLAFKDIALQFLGRLFEHLLAGSGGRLNILGATSGDTGSAAIHSIRGRDRMRICILHPRGRVSPLQERQMTTVPDANVFNLAVDGTFDDCQRIMKAIFSDVPFKRQHELGAVNSVNWARVLAQIVYYFHAGLKTMAATRARAVRFAVPTGNFGNILAGWFAARMGLPVSRLVLATNENDILARFFRTGVYRVTDVVPTVSPSMDIQVASNFERYLYYRVERNPEAVGEAMAAFARAGSVHVPGDPRERPRIAAGAGSTAATLEVIRRYHRDHGYLLDPHSAVGVAVAEQHLSEYEPMICLATAHPAKFPDAIRDAVGADIARHPSLEAIRDAPTRCEQIPADESAVRAYLERIFVTKSEIRGSKSEGSANGK